MKIDRAVLGLLEGCDLKIMKSLFTNRENSLEQFKFYIEIQKGAMKESNFEYVSPLIKGIETFGEEEVFNEFVAEVKWKLECMLEIDLELKPYQFQLSDGVNVYYTRIKDIDNGKFATYEEAMEVFNTHKEEIKECISNLWYDNDCPLTDKTEIRFELMLIDDNGDNVADQFHDEWLILLDQSDLEEYKEKTKYL